VEAIAAALEGELAELRDRQQRLEEALAARPDAPPGEGCGAGQVPVCCGEDETFCPMAGCADLENDPANCGECGRHCGGGACVGGECQAPPPRIDAQLDCACNDGARVSGCFPTTCAPEERVALCGRLCVDHRGVRADAAPGCFESPECAPQDPPPGDDKFLVCGCADGNRYEVCAPSDCSAEDRLRACEPACARNGGVSAANPPACFDGGDRCAPQDPPPPPPGGDKLLVCGCADGNRFEVCAASDCSAPDRLRVCDPVCARNGGVSAANPPACFDGGDRCAPPEPAPAPVPDKLLTCACNDGSRTQQCVVSTCADEERTAYCDRFCHERGGVSRDVPPSCFEAGPGCGVR
jgi:hypothetical protein